MTGNAISVSVARRATRRSSRWLAGTIICTASLFATQALAIDVASEADWNTAAAAVAAAGAGSTVTINFTAGFTLTSSLAQLQASNTGVIVNITGNNQTVNGNSFQGIQVNGANAPTVNISSLAITNTVASGGNGGNGMAGYYSASLSYGSGGGGGGGLGAGGGLFVGAGANVTLTTVTFTGSHATGGNGGLGGSAQNTASSPTGGNGGDGGALNGSGAVGGGGAGGFGGNTGTSGTAGTAGATAGAGGGGGGGSGTLNSTQYTSNNAGGNGNSGGGAGRPGGDGVTNDQNTRGPGADGGSGGNGGNAQGGAIYVATGGTLTILDTAISGSAVTGGNGGNSGVGQGPSSVNGNPGNTGTGQGAGIFLNGVTANIGVSTSVTYADTIGGTGLLAGGVTTGINKTGAGILTLSGTNTFTGDVDISGGTVAVASATNLGSGAKNVVMSTATTFATTATATFGTTIGFKIAGLSTFDVAPGTTTTIQGVIADGATAGTLAKNDTGTLVLTGTNTFTGGIDITAGTLRVGSAGALGTSGLANVFNGTLDLNGFNQTFNLLGGGGTVTGANVTISGTGSLLGTGVPNSSLSIVGNLTFQPGASYGVNLNPTTSSFTAVTGTTTIGANTTVNASFDPGAYIQKKYTILTATGGVSGTFGSVTGTPPGGNLHSTLSYDATDAYLNLALNFSIPGGLNQNQQAVGNALTNFFNSTGGIPAVYATLTPAGLSQASGETATGTQQTTFNAMNMFMGVMTDPFISGRNGGPSAGGSTTGYAEEESLAYAAKRNPNDALAAIYTKAPPAIPFEQRWSVWAAGFGGSQTTDGNNAVGSNSTTSSVYGTAVGADYRFSPDTIAGFALAGGGTSFSVVNNGTGRSDLFQAGAFIRHNAGPAYISAALAYGWQDVTTNRTVTIAGTDVLQARFNANAWSGRLEGGYRFATPGMGITPYAAGQFTTFQLPAYAESVLSGGGAFALAYGAQSVTDARSELGIRTDKSYAMQDGILTLRGRLAWAHDYDPNRNIGATFQALPGASFVVNGAAQAADSALTTVSAEMKWINGWSTALTFEGEFSQVTSSYAGKGVVRYAW
jgi:uncharacterized protein with beta-barrel porin domain